MEPSNARTSTSTTGSNSAVAGACSWWLSKPLAKVRQEFIALIIEIQFPSRRICGLYRYRSVNNPVNNFLLTMKHSGDNLAPVQTGVAPKNVMQSKFTVEFPPSGSAPGFTAGSRRGFPLPPPSGGRDSGVNDG